jgi:hypothetical protein
MATTRSAIIWAVAGRVADVELGESGQGLDEGLDLVEPELLLAGLGDGDALVDEGEPARAHVQLELDGVGGARFRLAAEQTPRVRVRVHPRGVARVGMDGRDAARAGTERGERHRFTKRIAVVLVRCSVSLSSPRRCPRA